MLPGPGAVSDDDPDLRLDLLKLGGVEFAVLSFPIAAADGLAPLSAAEREVALLALQGLSTQDIAERRSTSSRTVANQLASIFRKLGVSGRGQLAAALAGRDE